MAKGFIVQLAVGDIESSNFYIVTVPTPTDKNKRPYLRLLSKLQKV